MQLETGERELIASDEGVREMAAIHMVTARMDSRGEEVLLEREEEVLELHLPRLHQARTHVRLGHRGELHAGAALEVGPLADAHRCGRAPHDVALHVLRRRRARVHGKGVGLGLATVQHDGDAGQNGDRADRDERHLGASLLGLHFHHVDSSSRLASGPAAPWRPWSI